MTESPLLVRAIKPAVTLGLLLLVAWYISGQGSNFVVYLYGVGLIFAVATLGLHVLANDAGDISLAQGAQVALGAFIGAHLFDVGTGPLSPAILVLGSVAAGAISGAFVSLPMLRLRGLAVAIVTLLLNAVVFRFVLRFPDFVGGSGGLRVGDPGWIPRSDLHAVIWLTLLTFAAVLVVSRIRAGRLGLGLRALRANARLARAVGVPVEQYRITAYVIAGAMAGCAGSMWVLLHRGVAATAFTEAASLLLLTLALLGGSGSIVGPMAAAVLMGVLTGWLGRYGVAISFVGPIALIFVLIKHPGGINEQLAEAKHLLTSLRRGRTPETSESQEVVPDAPPTEGHRSGSTVEQSSQGSVVLEADDLAVSFGGLRAVDGVSMTVNRGEVRALVGPNGAGKTTLLNLLTGHVRPTRGVVRLGGVEITHERAHKRAALGLRRTFQVDGHLPDETGREHFRLGLHLQRAVSAEELHDREAALRRELGLTPTDLTTPLKDLPAGTARLIEIGTALALPGDLLLIDEPSIGLTTDERHRLAATLRELAQQGLAVIVIDHDTEFVRRVADRVTAMDAGRIIADGTPDAVFADEAFVASYMGVEVTP